MGTPAWWISRTVATAPGIGAAPASAPRMRSATPRPHVIFRHVKPHGGKDVFEAGFGGQLVPMLDDLVP